MSGEFEDPDEGEFQAPRNETVEATPETNRILAKTLSELQNRIAAIPKELNPQAYRYQVGLTVHNMIQEVGPQQPTEQSPSAEQFRQ